MAANEQLLHTYSLEIAGLDVVGFFHQCTGLEVRFDVLQYHEGGNNDFLHQLPGAVHYPNLVLSRGLTNEKAMQEWLVETQTKAVRKEIILTLKAGSYERGWTFADAFPVSWTGPTLDASGNFAYSETLEIAHSGLTMT